MRSIKNDFKRGRGELNPARHTFGGLLNGFSRQFRYFDIICLLLVIAASLSLFFTVYRIAIFNTVSYDNYAAYLLYIVGDPQGYAPGSPSVYRYLSVFLAVPFYFLPSITFRGMEDLPFQIEYVAATQAICAANVFYLTLASLIAFVYLRLRLNLPPEKALVAPFGFLLLSGYLSLIGVDGISLLPNVLLLIAVVEKRYLAFGLLIFISAGINEKIVIIFTLIFLFRFVFQTNLRNEYFRFLLMSSIALIIWVGFVFYYPFVGNQNQRDPSTYYSSFTNMIDISFSMQGLYLNIWPILILTVLWLLSLAAPRTARFCEKSDILVVGALVAIGFLLNVEFGVGRIEMHTFPLFLIGAILGAGRTSHN